MPDKKNSNNKHVNIYNKHILNTEKAKEREEESEEARERKENERKSINSKWLHSPANENVNE